MIIRKKNMEAKLVTFVSVVLFSLQIIVWIIFMKFSYFVNLTETHWPVKIIRKSILKNRLKIRLTANHPDLATWQEGLKDRSLPTTMRPTLKKTTHPTQPIKIYNNAFRNNAVNFIIKIVCLLYFIMFLYFFISYFLFIIIYKWWQKTPNLYCINNFEFWL